MAQTEEKIQMLNINDVGVWVMSGPSNDMINKVDRFGENISQTDQRVTTSQIRQIFTKMKSIEAKGFMAAGQNVEFMMLKPYLAYAAERHHKTKLDELKKILTHGMDKVLDGKDLEEQAKRFKNFCRLFEAILAYHKAHGGS